MAGFSRQLQPAPLPVERDHPMTPHESVAQAPNISSYFNTDEDQSFTITQGGKTDHFMLSDLECHPNVNNWVNKKTGHFIRKDRIEVIKKKVDRNQGRSDACMMVKKGDGIEIPSNFNEAVQSDHRQEWINAMEYEMKSLVENDIF